MHTLTCGRQAFLIGGWVVPSLALRMLCEPARYVRWRVGRDEGTAGTREHVREQRCDEQGLVWGVQEVFEVPTVLVLVSSSQPGPCV